MIINKKINIAIDGPSGSGKSTVSRDLAQKLGYTHINSGLFYRAIGYLFLQEKDLEFSENNILKLLDQNDIFLKDDSIFLNNENIVRKLSFEDVGKIASKVAQMSKIREWVSNELRKISNKIKGIIMDGRDITTNIMPNAELKIYLDANQQERAKRRLKESLEKGHNTTFDEVLTKITFRDQLDTNRESNPLQKSNDAIVIDATKLTIDEVVSAIFKRAMDIIQENGV